MPKYSYKTNGVAGFVHTGDTDQLIIHGKGDEAKEFLELSVHLVNMYNDRFNTDHVASTDKKRVYMYPDEEIRRGLDDSIYVIHKGRGDYRLGFTFRSITGVVNQETAITKEIYQAFVKFSKTIGKATFKVSSVKQDSKKHKRINVKG